MKKFINDYWWLIAVAVFLWWRKNKEKTGKDYATQPTPGTATATQATKTTGTTTAAAKTTATKTTAAETPTQSGTFTNTPTPPATHVCNAGTGTDIYQEAAKERAKYNTCPTHGSTMRHIHEYKAGHVTDYYECTVCGHRNIVYTK